MDYVDTIGRLCFFITVHKREGLQLSKLQHLLDANSAWASAMKERDSEFFSRLAEQQNPDYLWIGCSDSRVPVSQIVNLQPGDVFVHRNIANVVPNNDTNALSVIQYAVEALKVQHIVVCGHYGCGGLLCVLGPIPERGVELDVDVVLLKDHVVSDRLEDALQFRVYPQLVGQG